MLMELFGLTYAEAVEMLHIERGGPGDVIAMDEDQDDASR